MTDTDRVQVLIVDDHPVVRFGLVALIDSQRDMAVIAEAGNGDDALVLYERMRPDLLLLDLRLPGISGVEVIRKIRHADPHARVIILTTYDGDQDIYQALQAGARGYLIKAMSHDVLLEAIRQVHRGLRYIPNAITKHLENRLPDSDLTKREQEVLVLISKGASNKEIAARLGITEGTVKCHVNAILGRLGVNDRTHAAMIAVQRGIIHI